MGQFFGLFARFVATYYEFGGWDILRESCEAILLAWSGFHIRRILGSHFAVCGECILISECQKRPCTLFTSCETQPREATEIVTTGAACEQGTSGCSVCLRIYKREGAILFEK